MEPNRPATGEMAHIGKSVFIKGELSGSEDLYVDGEVEGTIELRGHSLTVGPNGRVRAHVHARNVVVQGKVTGNIQASERVDLRASANVTGDITTARIAVEDGAFFKGGIDVQRESKPEHKVEVKPEPKPEVKPAYATTAAGSSATSGSSFSSQQTSLGDHKKN
ncbi:MAG TPA: polymer-forming cytoskeletal protein [Terriglobales bacterium]|nr:polymer-forming cytoskeletal protein [Terriglobales bacterium]